MDPADFPQNLDLFIKCDTKSESAAVQRYLFGQLGARWRETDGSLEDTGVMPGYRNFRLERFDNGIEPPRFFVESVTELRRVEADAPTVDAEDLLVEGLEAVVENLMADDTMWDGPFGAYHASVDQNGDMRVWMTEDMNTREFDVTAEEIEAAGRASLEARGCVKTFDIEEDLDGIIHTINSVIPAESDPPRPESQYDKNEMIRALRRIRRMAGKLKKQVSPQNRDRREHSSPPGPGEGDPGDPPSPRDTGNRPPGSHQ